MRISDWSSDVCSSDLAAAGGNPDAPPRRGASADPVRTRQPGEHAGGQRQGRAGAADRAVGGGGDHARARRRQPAGAAGQAQPFLPVRAPGTAGRDAGDAAGSDRGAQAPRSEEHTSELQSLMRISYAVFCLKKKIKTTKRYTQTTHIE